MQTKHIHNVIIDSGEVPPGRVPRHKNVILVSDLVDSARPGEEIDITGIYVHSYDIAFASRAGFPIFSTTIEANHVAKKSITTKDAFSCLSEEEKRIILRLARNPRIQEQIALIHV